MRSFANIFIVILIVFFINCTRKETCKDELNKKISSRELEKYANGYYFNYLGSPNISLLTESYLNHPIVDRNYLFEDNMYTNTYVLPNTFGGLVLLNTITVTDQCIQYIIFKRNYFYYNFQAEDYKLVNNVYIQKDSINIIKNMTSDIETSIYESLINHLLTINENQLIDTASYVYQILEKFAGEVFANREKNINPLLIRLLSVNDTSLIDKIPSIKRNYNFTSPLLQSLIKSEINKIVFYDGLGNGIQVIYFNFDLSKFTITRRLVVVPVTTTNPIDPI